MEDALIDRKRTGMAAGGYLLTGNLHWPQNSRVPRISILLGHRNRRKGRRKVGALQTACPATVHSWLGRLRMGGRGVIEV